MTCTNCLPWMLGVCVAGVLTMGLGVLVGLALDLWREAIEEVRRWPKP